MARQDDHVRQTFRIPREVYERIAAIQGEGSLNAKLVNLLDKATSPSAEISALDKALDDARFVHEIILRDRFALAALPIFLRDLMEISLKQDTPLEVISACLAAYEVADGMLAVREKGADAFASSWGVQ